MSMRRSTAIAAVLLGIAVAPVRPASASPPPVLAPPTINAAGKVVLTWTMQPGDMSVQIAYVSYGPGFGVEVRETVCSSTGGSASGGGMLSFKGAVHSGYNTNLPDPVTTHVVNAALQPGLTYYFQVVTEVSPATTNHPLTNCHHYSNVQKLTIPATATTPPAGAKTKNVCCVPAILRAEYRGEAVRSVAYDVARPARKLCLVEIYAGYTVAGNGIVDPVSRSTRECDPSRTSWSGSRTARLDRDFYVQAVFRCTGGTVADAIPPDADCRGASYEGLVYSDPVKVALTGEPTVASTPAPTTTPVPAKKEPPSPGSQVVPIASVSNGCGGKGWKSFVKAQNYLGNTQTYYDTNDPGEAPRAKKFTVRFTDACNLHDAGYSGAVVKDKLRANRMLDHRKWSRKQVDDKFLEDLQWMCTLQIPRSAKIALENCKGSGGNLSIGANSLFSFVRACGQHFFDADPLEDGTQGSGPRKNDYPELSTIPKRMRKLAEYCRVVSP